MKAQNEVVTSAPVAAASTEVSTKTTPVNERLYSLVAAPSLPPKGKQRQIVLSILQNTKTPLTVDEVTKAATAAGLQAVGGIGPSCRYHLHHLVLLGIAKVENPTIEVVKEIAAKAA